jgi:hypothetical protein
MGDKSVIRNLKNRVAKGVLSRIHAVRLAETRGDYELGATVIEAWKWAREVMDALQIKTTNKEYSAAYRLYVKMGRIAKRNPGLITYEGGELVLIQPRSALGDLMNMVRNGVFIP